MAFLCLDDLGVVTLDRDSLEEVMALPGLLWVNKAVKS
jgi:hypothetical protein